MLLSKLAMLVLPQGGELTPSQCRFLWRWSVTSWELPPVKLLEYRVGSLD